MMEPGHAVITVHQPISARLKSGKRLIVRRRAVAQHDPYPTLLKVANGLQRTGFLRCQRDNPEGVLRYFYQRVQFADIQLTKQRRRMCPFVLWRKVGDLQDSCPVSARRGPGHTAPGDACERPVNSLQRCADGRR